MIYDGNYYFLLQQIRNQSPGNAGVIMPGDSFDYDSFRGFLESDKLTNTVPWTLDQIKNDNKNNLPKGFSTESYEYDPASGRLKHSTPATGIKWTKIELWKTEYDAYSSDILKLTPLCYIAHP